MALGGASVEEFSLDNIRGSDTSARKVLSASICEPERNV
jgi:hypothetical protein